MTSMPGKEDARRAYLHWLDAARGVSEEPQHPAEELLGEHYLMRTVMHAMDAEASELEAGKPLRAGFWAEVVDFIGNFVHQCHRAKEQEKLFAVAVEHGGLSHERAQQLADDHAGARDMTLSLVAAIESGDGEAILRIARTYLEFMQAHMQSEERDLFGPVRDDLPAANVEPVRAAFREIEEDRLASGRLHYVELARELCDMAGVEHALE